MNKNILKLGYSLIVAGILAITAFIVPATNYSVSAASGTVERQVSASTDDCYRTYRTSAFFSNTATSIVVGREASTDNKWGGGMRFTNITIPQGAIITVAYLKVTACDPAGYSNTNTPVYSRIHGQATDDASTFSDATNFDAKYAAKTTANVEWSVPAFTTDTTYTSPDIKTIIQEIVDREGWSSGNDLILFWHDFYNETTNDDSRRRVYSYDGSAVDAPEIYIEWVEQLTVETDAATNIEDTTTTLNGEITIISGDSPDYRGFVWDTTSRAAPADTAPSATSYSDYWTETGTYSTGTFNHALTGLDTGTTYYFRAVTHDDTFGWIYGDELSFLTKPAAPTNVSATDGTHNDKVVITWTKSTGATGYRIYEGTNLLDTLGDVATYDDTTAAAPTITAGSSVASDGTHSGYVALSLSGTSANNGATRTYKVIAVNATGDSDNSDTDTGYRGVGALTYQWQRSAADSDASYSNIDGATSATYNDTDGVLDPDGRYYKCVLNATGATQQTSTADRGYTVDAVPPVVTSIECIGYGDDWIILKGRVDTEGDAAVTEVGFEYGYVIGSLSTVSLTGTYGAGDTFIIKIEGLTNAKMYIWRAYADNGIVGYGEYKYCSTQGSPVIYEYINLNGDGNSADIYGNNWCSQFFTVGTTSHTVTSIRLNIKATGTPSTIVVSIKYADANGLPTGNDLVSTTLDGDLVPAVYTWYNLAVDETSLKANTGYCIVVRAEAGTAANYINWQQDTGGDGDDVADFASTSTDGGVVWTTASPIDYLFEIWGNTCIDVKGAKVFRSYYETDDMLIVAHFTNVYVPYYPNEIVRQYFNLVLKDPTGTTTIASVSCKLWDYGIGSIYLSADMVASLDDGAAYLVGLVGIFSPYPEDYYALAEADWLGTEMELLDNYVINIANIMEDYYGIQLTTSITGKGDVLNETGGVLILNGIPSLSNIRPELFQVLVYVPTYDAETWTLDYDTTKDWQALLGTDISDFLSSIEDMTGADDKNWGIIIVLALYIGVVLLITKLGGSPSIAAAIGSIVPMVGTVVGLISIVWVAVVVAIFVLAFIMTHIWSRT